MGTLKRVVRLTGQKKNPVNLIVILHNSPGEWNASADNARLYMEDDFTNFRIGAWCAEYPPRQGEWLKIDLGRKKTVTAVATQG